MVAYSELSETANLDRADRARELINSKFFAYDNLSLSKLILLRILKTVIFKIK